MCVCIAVANQVGKAWGQDIAEKRVATKVTPLGNVTDNVFHHCDGFGWYANMHAPLKVKVDAQGYVMDWATACPWNFVTGEDHAASAVVRNHLELGNDFSWGSYEMSDTSCYNCTLVDGLKPVYWKVRNTHTLNLHTRPPGWSAVRRRTAAPRTRRPSSRTRTCARASRPSSRAAAGWWR